MVKLPQANCPTIRQVFPLAPDKLFNGLSVFELAECLSIYENGRIVFDNLANWIQCQPSICIGAMLPGLWIARDQHIACDRLPLRIIKYIRRFGIELWGEIIELTPSILNNIRGFGEGCLQQFLILACEISLNASIKYGLPSRVPNLNLFEQSRLDPTPDFRMVKVLRLVQWALNESQGQNLQEVLTACLNNRMPSDISLIYNSLNSSSLSSIFHGTYAQNDIDALILDFYGILDSRALVIFKSRISFNRQQTLGELGCIYSLSKERIRQIFLNAEDRLRKALETPRFAPIAWRGYSFKNELGIGLPVKSQHYLMNLEKFIKPLKLVSQEDSLDLLLWIAGPYSINFETGWLQSEDLPKADFLNRFLDKSGIVCIDNVERYLAKCGLHSNVHSIWLDTIGKVKCIDKKWLIWHGTILDKALQILNISGTPDTVESIINITNEEIDAQAFRNRLMNDDRFIRVDKNRFGLRIWGLEEYSTIAGSIEKEIQANGGLVNLEHLIEILGVNFDLRASSIRAYSKAPMFYQYGKMIRLRTKTDPIDVVQSIFEIPNCYLLDKYILVWRIVINGEDLRGSSRKMAPSIVNWVGVKPGGNKTFFSVQQKITVTWPETSIQGGTLGSIRSFLCDANVQIGDQVLIKFDIEKQFFNVLRIDPDLFESSSGFHNISNLTGLSFVGDQYAFLNSLGRSLGVNGSVAAISDALKRRGEFDILKFIAIELPSNSPDLGSKTSKIQLGSTVKFIKNIL